MARFVADFETTTVETDCRVWGFGMCEVGNTTNCVIGRSIDDFMNGIKYDDSVGVVYFHNLKFDGEFILSWLFQNGYRFSENKTIYPGEFTTLISDMGVFYSIKINMDKHMITIFDSLKIIPLPVSKIPKAFGLPQSKGEIDYTMQRPVGYEMTNAERDYILHDVTIVADALKQIFDSGLEKMTQAANALDGFNVNSHVNATINSG